jgi:hypothetical protein
MKTNHRREKMLTKVDCKNGHTTFKVTSQKGKLICYRTFPTLKIGSAPDAREFPTLKEARTFMEDAVPPVGAPAEEAVSA